MGQTILTAVGDKALSRVPRESRDAVRADILRAGADLTGVNA